MSPQQDVSVRDLLAVDPAVRAICTPPEGDGDEAGRTAPPDGEPRGRAERPPHQPQEHPSHVEAEPGRRRLEHDRHQVERFGTAAR
jgi:hypothetical protein